MRQDASVQMAANDGEQLHTAWWWPVSASTSCACKPPGCAHQLLKATKFHYRTNVFGVKHHPGVASQAQRAQQRRAEQGPHWQPRQVAARQVQMLHICTQCLQSRLRHRLSSEAREPATLNMRLA